MAAYQSASCKFARLAIVSGFFFFTASASAQDPGKLLGGGTASDRAASDRIVSAPKSSATPSRAPVQTSSVEIERGLAARMKNAERVNIRIPGYAALSGEYRINGDGAVSLPGIGRIEVGELTIAEFEDQLAGDIARISSRETSVAIEVVEYRPVFVSGVVARTGAYPWKPGLTVLHAETLAGGVFRGPSTGDAAVLAPTTDRERERAVRAAYDLAATHALMARLKVERGNGDTFALPARVASLISKSEQDTMAKAQQVTLLSRNLAFNNRITAAENAKNMAKKEIKALEAQQFRVLDQLAKRRATLKKVEVMTGQGYTRGDRLFEEQVRISELEERLTNTSLAISKMEFSAAAAQQEYDSLALGRKAEIDTELLALEQKAAQLEIEIESANGLYQRITGQDAIASRSAQPMVATYEVVRVKAGVSTVIPVERTTQLQPNDVLIVSFTRRGAS